MQGKKLPKHSGAVRLLIEYRHCACVKRHLDVFDPDQSGRPGPVEDATLSGTVRPRPLRIFAARKSVVAVTGRRCVLQHYVKDGCQNRTFIADKTIESERVSRDDRAQRPSPGRLSVRQRSV